MTENTGTFSRSLASLGSDAERAELELAHPELKRFTTPNFAVPGERGREAEALRTVFYDAAANILLSSPPSKSRAVALTELETSMMWAIKAFYGAPGEEARE